MSEIDKFFSAQPLATRQNLYRDGIQNSPLLQIEGKITGHVGLALEAQNFPAPIDARCLIHMANGETITAEVIGFHNEKTYLMPLENLYHLSMGARVIATSQFTEVSVGPDLMGRIIDAHGKPLDNLGPIAYAQRLPLHGCRLNPMLRLPISRPFDTGVRAINTCFALGTGERVGLLSESGSGKENLLGMISRYHQADVAVIALVGQPGHLIKEFITQHLNEQGLRKAVVVVSPLDDPLMAKIHCALRATCIAEYFRNTGANVLLIIDSLTNFANAHQEIAVSMNETQVLKNYSPSVFIKIASLIERAGCLLPDGGAITSLYTLSITAGHLHDPFCEVIGAMLDGRIVLSRQLAEAGDGPAIDIENSTNNAMKAVLDSEQRAKIHRLKQCCRQYQQSQELMSLGAYQPGHDPAVDESLLLYPKIKDFLKQTMDQQFNFVRSWADLNQLFKEEKKPVKEKQHR